MATTLAITKRIVLLLLVLLMAFTLMFAITAPEVSACGCGTTDHSYKGSYPWAMYIHNYMYHYTIHNAHFHVWEEISFGGYDIHHQFCWCVIQGVPCVQ